MEVVDCREEKPRVVGESAEACVAIKTKHPPHPPGDMVVIDLGRLSRPAERAAPTLGFDHLRDLGLPKPEPLRQVIVARVPVSLLYQIPPMRVPT